MEMSCQAWRDGTAEFVPHHVLAEYIQESAETNGVLDLISFRTRVNHIEKTGQNWRVSTAQLVDDPCVSITDDVQVRL